MAITHHWVSKELLIAEYSGKVTGQELVAAVLEISGDPRFYDLRGVLGDWRNITEPSLTTGDMEKTAAYVEAIAKSAPNIKLATLMLHEESREALEAFFSLLVEHTSWETEGFNNPEAACRWLGVAPESVAFLSDT